MKDTVQVHMVKVLSSLAFLVTIDQLVEHFEKDLKP